jgi:hypothetical protein
MIGRRRLKSAVAADGVRGSFIEAATALRAVNHRPLRKPCKGILLHIKAN